MFNSLCRSTSRLLVGVGVGGGTTLVYNVQHTTAVADHAPATQAAIRLGHDANPSRHFVSNRTNESKYSLAEVSEHDGRDGGSFWITYKDGVYDLTDFINDHPGGRYINQAAGGSVSGFWEHWSYHHLSGKVLAELEKHRIGTLVGWKEGTQPGDLYTEEPYHRRTAGQNVLITQPYNSETKPQSAWKLFTETDDFYVRNHSPVPSVDAEDLVDYDLTFTRSTLAAASGAGGPSGDEIAATTLPELLAKFRSYTVTSIMQCAGNRAADNITANNAGGFIGTPYELIDTGMAGNAQWSGPRMRDVLLEMYPELAAIEAAAGAEAAAASKYGGMHVEFEGVDGYYTSTPLEIIMDAKNDCLLATHMNGAPLPPDHGYPLRAVLPGRAGCRNAKWVNRITVRNDEGDSPWNVTYYKGGEPGGKYTIQDLPLQSIIHEPSPGGKAIEKITQAAPLSVRGVAYSGASGSTIDSVEVSVDGGRTWQAATVMHNELVKDDSSQFYGWVRWEHVVDTMPTDFVPGTDQQTGTFKSGELTVLCRATATDGTTQPRVGALNGGYLYNGYHKMVVPVKMH